MSGVEVRNQGKVVPIPARLLDIDSRTKRDAYDPGIFERLFNSIQEHGFRGDKPLSVRLNPKGRGYLINCGQHRYEAGLKAGIKAFPCVIKTGQTNVEAVIEAYKDNAIAGSLDAITEAKLFRKIGEEILKEEAGTVNGPEPGNRLRDKIAQKTGVTSKYVQHRLPLLKLPKYAQDMVKRYYQPSLKGSKLSPTIAEELYLTQEYIKILNDAGIVEKTDIEEAIKYLSTKYSKERTSLVEARKIKADIAVRGFEEWKNNLENGTIHTTNEEKYCAICGAAVADSPWRPFCPEHISMIEEMARSSLKPVNGLSENRRQNAMRKYLKFNDLVQKAYLKQSRKIPTKIQDYLERLHRDWKSFSEPRGYVV